MDNFPLKCHVCVFYCSHNESVLEKFGFLTTVCLAVVTRASAAVLNPASGRGKSHNVTFIDCKLNVGQTEQPCDNDCKKLWRREWFAPSEISYLRWCSCMNNTSPVLFTRNIYYNILRRNDVFYGQVRFLWSTVSIPWFLLCFKL